MAGCRATVKEPIKPAPSGATWKDGAALVATFLAPNGSTNPGPMKPVLLPQGINAIHKVEVSEDVPVTTVSEVLIAKVKFLMENGCAEITSVRCKLCASLETATQVVLVGLEVLGLVEVMEALEELLVEDMVVEVQDPVEGLEVLEEAPVEEMVVVILVLVEAMEALEEVLEETPVEEMDVEALDQVEGLVALEEVHVEELDVEVHQQVLDQVVDMEVLSLRHSAEIRDASANSPKYWESMEGAEEIGTAKSKYNLHKSLM